MTSDRDYIESKLKHMKHVLGINAAINPTTGAAQPDWAKNEAAERQRNHARYMKRKAEREKAFFKEEE